MSQNQSPQEARQAEQDLLTTVLVNRQEPGMHALIKLLDLRVAKLKDRLMNCPPEEFLVLQAEAKVLNKLVVELRSSVPQKQ